MFHNSITNNYGLCLGSAVATALTVTVLHLVTRVHFDVKWKQLVSIPETVQECRS